MLYGNKGLSGESIMTLATSDNKFAPKITYIQNPK